MSLAKATRKAVHDALVSGSESSLAALIEGRVYDRVPATQPPYPYLTVDIDIADDANTCLNSKEVHVTVHIWSNVVGRQQVETIAGLIEPILNKEIAIAGYVNCLASFDAEDYRAGDGPLVTEGVLSFTYLVDPETE